MSWPCRRATGHHFGDLPVAGRADVIARLDAAVGIEVPAGTDRDASSVMRQTQVASREDLGGVRLKGGPIPGGDVAASGLGEVDAHLVVLEVLNGHRAEPVARTIQRLLIGNPGIEEPFDVAIGGGDRPGGPSQRRRGGQPPGPMPALG